MKTLQIDESKAKIIYNTASAELKIMLEDTFGKELFSRKVTDRIKNIEDACNELGKNHPLVCQYYGIDDVDCSISAYLKLRIICAALNEGWEPNWKDGNQKKWIPWFCPNSSSGFVFDSTNCRNSIADMGYGLRLCFKSDELATYAGKQFVDLYKEFIL